MSAAVETERRYTPEELLAMPDGKNYELVGGKLLERNMGVKSSWVGGQIYSRLNVHCKEHHAGWALPADTGYQCFPHDPGLVRKPDVSFVRRGRFPSDVLPDGWAKIPPDLAVEVVSPNDSADALEGKLDDYQKVDVLLVWVVYLKSRTLMVYRSDGSVSRLRESDELSGEDVIPGFRCPVKEILPPRDRAGAEAPPTTTGPNGPQ
jgi:Uma2 family endonuclease